MRSNHTFVFTHVVDYSTINYKDALVVTGNYAGLKCPMVGGIDIAGTVTESQSPGTTKQTSFKTQICYLHCLNFPAA